ncbi:hypothetical protein D9611_004417 [Ephemerocybe angulata]|uniref:J domain-containing protein n=1 Tax=Ephemerocybe angulata TaxID=980116 RepID=A0A8H5F5L3_9AGAR|nr:hypothetical protein D9611_004417 [Tulosesus angulatus]
MIKDTKYYDILEVAPDATKEQITMAFHKKVTTIRASGNLDLLSYKAVNDAHRILTDPSRRAVYDERGPGEPAMLPTWGPTVGQTSGRRSLGDAEAWEVSGSGGTTVTFSEGMAIPRKAKARTLYHRIQASLEDFYLGTKTKLEFTRKNICYECKGLGGKDTKTKRCTACVSGEGSSQCSRCGGRGIYTFISDTCTVCRGYKVVTERRSVIVPVERGIRPGETVLFADEGDRSPEMDPGDLVVTIEETSHPQFRRLGDDLVMQMDIDLLTSLVGGEVSIKHLDKRIVSVSLPSDKVILNGDLKVVPLMGMPVHRAPTSRTFGDLYIRFFVKYPERIDGRSVPLLRDALGHDSNPQEKRDGDVPSDRVSAREPEKKPGSGQVGDKNGLLWMR